MKRKNCKKRTICILGFLLLGIFLSSGCARRLRPIDLLEKKLSDDEENAAEAEKERIAIETNRIEDPGEAQEIILQSCTSDMIAGYAIDEAFLAWFLNSYGEDTMEQVATAVNNGYEDPRIWYDLTGSTMHVLWAEYCRDTGYQSERLTNVYWKDAASQDETILDFTGDISFAEGIGTVNYMDKQSNGIEDCISADIFDELCNADITMLNNEFTYSTRGTPIPGKDYTFRADPSRVSLLEKFGTDIVGLANNHTYDYGPEALLDTLDTFDEAGIPHVGAGKNLDEAKEPVYFIVNGRKIGITAATQIERSKNYTKEATDTSPGVLKTLNPDKYVQVIEETKKQCDIVIAFVHWGTENKSNFEKDQIALAQKFAAAGADVIIGGHTHCLQGISYVDDVPVIYSLGNFWFSVSAGSGASRKETGISQVIIEDDGDIVFRFLPCVQENYKTYLVTDETEKAEILSYMEGISDGISLDEDGYVIRQ